MHFIFDGPNNSITAGFTGSSRHARTPDVEGDAKISTNASVTGTSSLYLDGTGDYLSIADTDDFNFGEEDFTIEFWINRPTYNLGGVYGMSDGSNNNRWNLYTATENGFNEFFFFWVYGGSGVIEARWGNNTTLTTDAWHHIAISRAGGTWLFHLDGVKQSPTFAVGSESPGTTDVKGLTQGPWIGRTYSGGSYYPMSGYLDEFKIYRGQAQYSSSFSIDTKIAATGSKLSSLNTAPSSPVEETTGLSHLVLTSGSNNEPDASKTGTNLYIEDNGADSNTVLLLHCDGPDEGTSFTDSSPLGHTVTVNGSKTDNGHSVFGTSSAYFDGSNDYLSIADHADFDFGTHDDFTLEFWMKSANSTGNAYIIDRTSGGSYANFSIQIQAAGTMRIIVDNGSDNGYDIIQSSATSGLDDDEWHHIAWCRSSGDTFLYIDGAMDSNFPVTNVYNVSYSDPITIGLSTAFNSSGQRYSGYLDEIRLSSVCRYSGSSFDVPTKQFGRPDLKLKDESGTYTIKLKQIN